MRFVLNDSNACTADYTDRGYECAAWWQEYKALPGTYPIVRNPKPDFHNPAFAVIVAAVTGYGHFPSLFGGVSISREPYDGMKHAGKPGAITVKLTARAVITDSRCEIDDADYGPLLDEAILEAEKEFEQCKGFLADAVSRDARYTAIDKPMIPAFYYRALAEAATLLSRLNDVASDRAQKGYENSRLTAAVPAGLITAWKEPLVYDPACRVLALHFLRAEGREPSAAEIEDLAQAIQTAVERWFELPDKPALRYT